MSALRTGYTTGSCAAAAAKAAVRLLVGGRVTERLEIPLPGGARTALPLVYARLTGSGAEAAVLKDAGDDPDVTNGALILASVAWNGGDDIEFSAGEGVGTVTKPGLAIPPGEPAINPVPGDAGFSITRPAPNLPMTAWGIVPFTIGTFTTAFFASSTPFAIASATSFAFPSPTPT